ncbi:hypothetical protein LTS18_006293, partial [Coniosporium uncinatum]
MSVTVRERDWEEQSSRSSAPRTFTTVRRYKVPERPWEDNRDYDEMRVVRREVEPRRELPAYSYRIVDRGRKYEEPQAETREIRVVRRRSASRSPSPEYKEWRVERERDVNVRTVRNPYDLEKYSKSTEYFSQPEPQPQPIIIRQAAPQPIIIQEEAPRQQIVVRREEPSYEVIEKSEVAEETKSVKSLVKSEAPPPPPAPEPQEPEYYYERV